MTDAPKTPAQYIRQVADDKRPLVKAIRQTIRENLQPGFAEGMQYDMIGYYVPRRVYPAGYHCDPSQPVPFAAIAAQKNHVGIYLFCIYTDPAVQADFVKRWNATGCRLDMGKSCVRVKSIDQVPLDVLGETIRRIPVKAFLAAYERVLAGTSSGRRSARTTTGKSTRTAAARRKTSTTAAKRTTNKTATGRTASTKTATASPKTRTPKKGTSSAATTTIRTSRNKKRTTRTGRGRTESSRAAR